MTNVQKGMRVALHLNSYASSARDIGPQLHKIGYRADQAGVSAIALMDHFLHPGPQPQSDPVLEGYTALGFLAAATKTTDLMLLVSGVTHRPPALLAKAVTTLDVLSGGRARLGIGAGWFEAENQAYGLPFPATGERFAMLAETLEILRQMWSDDEGAYDGDYFQLGSTLCAPMPLRRPRPPIIIGGNGRTRTIHLAAKYADGWNFLAGPHMGGLAEARSLIETLHDQCARVHRDPAEIDISMLYTSSIATDRDGAARFVDELRKYAQLGVSEVFVMPTRQRDIIQFVDELASHVIPRARLLASG